VIYKRGATPGDGFDLVSLTDLEPHLIHPAGMSHTATERYGALRPVLSINEAARVLGIERATVYRLLRAGELESVRVGKRQKFRPEDLDAYLERRRGKGP